MSEDVIKNSSVMEIDNGTKGNLSIKKEYTCDYCHERFKQKSKLKKHCQFTHKTK